MSVLTKCRRKPQINSTSNIRAFGWQWKADSTNVTGKPKNEKFWSCITITTSSYHINTYSHSVCFLWWEVATHHMILRGATSVCNTLIKKKHSNNLYVIIWLDYSILFSLLSLLCFAQSWYMMRLQSRCLYTDEGGTLAGHFSQASLHHFIVGVT